MTTRWQQRPRKERVWQLKSETRRQTAAVLRCGHEVAAETAERTCLTGLAGTRGAVPGDPFSVCRGMAGEEHEVRSGGNDEENKGKLLQTQESCAKCL